MLSLPYLAISLNNNGFLSLLPFVQDDFALTRAQVGSYTTLFFASAALLAVFTGSLVDRLGSRTGIVIGLGCMGSAMLLYGFAPSFPVLLGLTFVAGLGFSIITPSVNKGVMTGAPPDKRATSMGIMQSGIGIGGFAGASLLPVLGEAVGWRLTIQSTAVFALLIAAAVFVTYRDSTGASEISPDRNAWKADLISLFSNLRILAVCCLGMVYGSLLGSAITHYTVFLSGDLRFSAAMAGLGLGILHIGGIGGRPLWGWLSDSVFGGDRSLTLFSVGLITGGLYLLMGITAYTTTFPPAMMYTFSFALGLSVLSWISVYFVAVGEMADKRQAGTATGMALLFNRVGILAAPPLFGLLADATGTYQLSWLLLGGLAVCAAAIFYLSHQRGRRGGIS